MPDSLSHQPSEREKERVLGYVNRLAKRAGLKPVKQLPRGRMQDGEHCVIANALNNAGADYAVVEPIVIEVHGPEKEFDTEPPLYVTRFINHFDNGAYPELVE